MTRHKYVNKRGKVVYYYFAQISHKKIPLGTSYLMARDKLLDILYEVAKTRKIKSAGTTFAEWSRRYLDLMSSKASVDRDRQMIQHLNNFFGNTPLSNITATQIIEYKNRRLSSGLIRAGKICDSKIKLSTVNREMSCLRHMLNLASADGLIKKEALPAIKLESEERFERDRTLSDNEYENYLEHSPRWYQRIVIAAWETGMSRKDILLLPWINVDRVKQIIRGKRVKRGVRQIVPITGKLPRILDELKKEQKSQVDLVFTKEGQPITAIMVRNAHDVAVKRAGINDFHFHDLRHTAKSRWARHGVPAEIAMLATGQKSLRMHYRYVDLKEEDVVEAFKEFME